MSNDDLSGNSENERLGNKTPMHGDTRRALELLAAMKWKENDDGALVSVNSYVPGIYTNCAIGLEADNDNLKELLGLSAQVAAASGGKRLHIHLSADKAPAFFRDVMGKELKGVERKGVKKQVDVRHPKDMPAPPIEKLCVPKLTPEEVAELVGSLSSLAQKSSIGFAAQQLRKKPVGPLVEVPGLWDPLKPVGKGNWTDDQIQAMLKNLDWQSDGTHIYSAPVPFEQMTKAIKLFHQNNAPSAEPVTPPNGNPIVEQLCDGYKANRFRIRVDEGEARAYFKAHGMKPEIKPVIEFSDDDLKYLKALSRFSDQNRGI